MNRPVARRGDEKPDHAFLLAELLDELVGRVGIVERQVEHRHQSRLARQHPLTEPAIVGARQRHLNLDLRMHAERQHRRREQHRDVDADRVHPALGQRDVALILAGWRLLQAAQRIARDAAAHILITHHRVHDAGVLGVRLRAGQRQLAQHRIVEIFENLVQGLIFIVMRIDVDDRELVIAALARLTRRVRQQLRGVEFLHRHAAEIAELEVHGLSLPGFDVRCEAPGRMSQPVMT
jgi:hypothetical protein